MKSSAERVQKHVKKRKEAGLIQAKVWIHPDEAADLRKYAKKKPLTLAILNELK